MTLERNGGSIGRLELVEQRSGIAAFAAGNRQRNRTGAIGLAPSDGRHRTGAVNGRNRTGTSRELFAATGRQR
jgi:hypothetical protein